MLPSSNGLTRSIRRLGGIVFNSATYIDLFFAKISPPPLKPLDGYRPRPDSKKVLIYACFCSSAQELQSRYRDVMPIATEFDEVLVINAGSALGDQLSSGNVVFLSRKNWSRDLGSYRDALTAFELANIDELVLINDSVEWLQDSLLGFVSKSRLSDSRITGITESMQLGRHIQSFAMHFKRPSRDALNPILKVGNWRLKRTLVLHGERHFSKIWGEENISFSPLYSIELLQFTCLRNSKIYGEDEDAMLNLIQKSIDLNPSIHLWPALLLHAKIAKKSLLRDNPAKFANSPKTLKEVQAILGELS